MFELIWSEWFMKIFTQFLRRMLAAWSNLCLVKLDPVSAARMCFSVGLDGADFRGGKNNNKKTF